MRVSDQSFALRFLSGLAASRERGRHALEALADGKKMRVGSDDPGSASESLALRARLTRLSGLDRSARSARTDLATVESALGRMVELFTEAQSEAMAGASIGTDEANEARAAAIDALAAELRQIANTSQAGRYLFSGTETGTPPFNASGFYQGNGAEVQAPLEVGETVGATLAGRDVFQGAAGDLFTLLGDLSQALRDNRTDLVSGLVPAVGAAISHAIGLRADVGTRLERIDRVLVQHEDETVRLSERAADLEDADLAQVIVELNQAEESTAALSAAAARVLGRSLFDYLA